MRDGAPDLQDMFGNPEVERKSKPVKGQRYLIFTLIMMIFLSFMVETKEKTQILATYNSATNSTSTDSSSSTSDATTDTKNSTVTDDTTAKSDDTSAANTTTTTNSTGTDSS